MDRYLVISSDCHAGLPPEQYRDYLDPQYREAFDVALPIQIAQTEAAAKDFLVADINADWRRGNEAGLTGAWSYDDRVKVLDDDGIAAEIVFPDGITEMNSPPFGAGIGLPTTEDINPELQWAGARAHNRWVAELCQMAPERHFGLAIVLACWDIDEAVREVKWARANGLRGVMLPVMWGKRPPYHDMHYDPLWKACAESDMVVHFHSGPAPSEDYFGSAANPADPSRRHGSVGIYISEVAMWLTRPLTFMLWGGVFERFPKLKVAIVEGTSVWVPEYLRLLEQRYSEAHYSQKLGDFRSHLSKSPADYFRENVAVGASCMPRREAELRAEIGVDQIMWGNDYPHPEGDWPFTRKYMIETFRGLPENEIAAMLGENATRFYGFDGEKLAPLVARIGPKKSDFQEGGKAQ